MTNLQKGLVGHWTLDAGASSNSTAYDSSAYDNHGNLVDVTTGTSGPGNFDAHSFNGSTSYMRISEPATFTSSVLFTLSGWINPDGTDGWVVNPRSAGYDQYIVYDSGNSSLRLGYVESANTNARNHSTNTGSVPSGSWSHFSFIINESANTVRGYINGVEQFNVTDTGPITGWTLPWSFGRRDNGTNFWAGDLSELRLYNRALSESEISALYNMRSQRQQNTATLMNTTVNGKDVTLQRDSYGSWICIQNYEHYGGTDPTPSPGSTFPQLPNGRRTISDIQGAGANGELRHVDNITQYGSWNVDAVRLEAMTSNHGRKIHYLSENQSVIDAVVDNTVDVGHSELKASLTKYPDHTSFLPDDMAADNDNQTTGNADRIFGYEFPMYGDGSDGTRVHWAMSGNGSRWEVDDSSSSGSTTIHRVWVRTGLFD